MALADKSLTCVECGAPFTFTSGEQEFFASRGYTNEPKRCPECRSARKNQQRGGTGAAAGSAAAPPERCTPWYVPSAASIPWCPSCPGETARCTAAIVSAP